MLCINDDNTAWDKSWGEIFSVLEQELSEDALMDVGCFVGKRLKDLEEKNLADCRTEDTTMRMPTKSLMDSDIYLSGLIIPLLDTMENLKTMDFGSFVDVVLSMSEIVGVTDLNEFSGWKIANKGRELVTSMVESMEIEEYSFQAEYVENDFFCANGGVKRECNECSVGVCRNEEKYDLQCSVDECNNCAVSYTYDPDGNGDQEFTCERMYKRCEFPDYIPNGYKHWEGRSEEGPYAFYECHLPFVMNPNRDMMYFAQENEGDDITEAYKKYSHFAWCDESDENDKSGRGKIYFPECVKYEEARHCGLPSYIENGEAVEFMMEDDYMMPTKARYECYSGYEMYHTIHHDHGWCRMDGSMEIPSCVKSADYMNLKFELQNGNIRKLQRADGKVFGGIVLAMGVDPDDKPKTAWEYGCNDGTNNYAAGAICRSLGFESGEQIPASKKMVFKKHEFGWTKFSR